MKGDQPCTTYDYDILDTAKPVNVQVMNEQAAEAAAFMSNMGCRFMRGAKASG